MKERYAIILAAGQGTRMKSKLYKVMHPVAGKPMVGHVYDQVNASGVDKTVTIVGVGAETVQDYLGDKSEYSLQEEQLGTAHAVMQAENRLQGKKGTTLVICGDTPLFTKETLEAGFKFHEDNNSKATVVSAMVEDSHGYGRVIRDEDGGLARIVEEKDATENERQVKEINTGTYYFDNEALFEVLKEVGNENAQGEYYLPDVIEILKNQSESVAAFPIPDTTEALGVNNRIALSEAEALMRKRINEKHMTNGVTFIDPAATYIESDVEIGQDTVIEANVTLTGSTVIGEDCVIQAGSRIADSQIGDQVEIRNSTIEESKIDSKVDVGPYSHIRPDTWLKEGVHVGNFAEIKKSTLGKNTKVGHHTYVGDAEIGEEVNFGAGSVIVNYDGNYKHKSIIEDRAFIGCNANIVSPVHIGKDTVLGAGSTLTKDINEGELAIERSEQANIPGYTEKIRKRWEAEEEK